MHDEEFTSKYFTVEKLAGHICTITGRKEADADIVTTLFV